MKQPTIGIEIELPWRTMLARVDEDAAQILAESQGYYSLGNIEQARVQVGFDRVDKEYKERVSKVFGELIKEKSDGYTEFAFTPRVSHEQLTETAASLYAEHILVGGEHYPLHVTLGGLSVKNSSWLVLLAAEMSGGSTQKRITQVNTWSQKGVAGMRQRGARELELGATVAVEMRSLVATSHEQLGATLEIAQRVGGVLLADIQKGTGQSRQWKELRAYLLDAAEQKGVDARTRWRNPQHDHGPWLSLGAALADTDWSAGIREDVLTILQG